MSSMCKVKQRILFNKPGNGITKKFFHGNPQRKKNMEKTSTELQEEAIDRKAWCYLAIALIGDEKEEEKEEGKGKTRKN